MTYPKCLDLSTQRSCLQQFEGQPVAITGLVRDHKATNLGYANVLLINVSISELSTTTIMEDRPRYFYDHMWMKVPDDVEYHTKSVLSISSHISGIAQCESYRRQDGTSAFGIKYLAPNENCLCDTGLIQTLYQNLNKIRVANIPYAEKLQLVMTLSKTAQDLVIANSVFTFEYSKAELLALTNIKALRTKIGMLMPSNRAGRRAQKRLRQRFPMLQLA